MTDMIEVGQAVGIKAQTFADTDEGEPLQDTTDATRRRVRLARTGQSLTLRLSQLVSSAATRVYSVEVAYRVDPLEEDGQ